MKKITNILTLFALVAAVSCNEKEPLITDTNPGYVTFEMDVKIPEAPVVVTKGDCASDPIIDHIYVATFGRNQYLNEYVKAIPVGDYASTNSPDTYRMKVTLLATTSPRHVHVIANGPESLDYQTMDKDLMLQMSTTYLKKDNKDVPQGAYWQYFYLADGTAVIDDNGNWEASPAANTALKNILLVRNFARVTVVNEATENFVLTGFHVFRTENEGSIAMPTSEECGQKFVNTLSYTTIPEGTRPINYIKSLPYAGYTPAGVSLHDETATTDVEWFGSGSYQFVYESVKGLSTGKEPFIILEGHLASETETKYYKMELIDADGNEFPILRNLDYSIVIESVADEIIGADTPGEARTCNGSISTSVSSNLSQLSDGYSSLAVLYTDKSYVNTESTSKSVNFMYLYDPAIDAGSSVSLEIVSSDGAGHAIDGADGSDWYTVSDGPNGWKNVSFDILPSDTYTDEAITVFKVTGKSKVTADGELQSLFRYVTVHLLSMQEFISPSVDVDGVAKDSDVTISFTLPDGLPVSLFPLIIKVDDTENSLNPKGTDMPLVLDSNGVYHFEKTVSWEEYNASKDVTCSMRFIKAVTSTVISIDSEFFTGLSTNNITAAGTYELK